MSQIAVLLVNLGTPQSPSFWNIYRYLIEFLTDSRVLDIPWWRRQLLVRGVIVPSRVFQSTNAYKKIWTSEGSPLLLSGEKVVKKLQEALGDGYRVQIAMRYQFPSIRQRLAHLLEPGVDHLIVLPLFPQYASATTGSVYQAVQKELSHYSIIPRLTFIDQYSTHPKLIEAFCALIAQHSIDQYDHLLLSFHGLPVRQLKNPSHPSSYSFQCHATAQAILNRLQIDQKKVTISFQSRLGKETWLQPYTNDMIHQLAKEGKKRILVLSPSFVCDCLETLYEIGIEYAEEFKRMGGEELQLISGLNEHPLWVDTLASLVREAH